MTANQKTISLLLFSILCLSYSLKNKKKEKTTNTPIIKVALNQSTSIDSKEFTSEKMIKNQDCIFDQETQTDEFLKGIEELKNYSWDSKIKTATIKLSKEETLEIFRGGCDHFSLSAKFIIKKTITFSKDKDFIFSKLLWISKLIYHESEYKKIFGCLSKNKYSIDDSNPNKIHINLIDHRVYNSFTILYNAENQFFNTFSIDYSLN